MEDEQEGRWEHHGSGRSHLAGVHLFGTTFCCVACLAPSSSREENLLQKFSVGGIIASEGTPGTVWRLLSGCTWRGALASSAEARGLATSSIVHRTDPDPWATQAGKGRVTLALSSGFCSIALAEVTFSHLCLLPTSWVNLY